MSKNYMPQAPSLRRQYKELIEEVEKQILTLVGKMIPESAKDHEIQFMTTITTNSDEDSENTWAIDSINRYGRVVVRHEPSTDTNEHGLIEMGLDHMLTMLEELEGKRYLIVNPEGEEINED